MEYCGDGECNCGEVCDPTAPGQSGCNATCTSWTDINDPVVTINGVGKASDPNNWLNSGFEVKMTFTELNGGDSGLNTCQYKVVNFGEIPSAIPWVSAVSCNGLTDSGSITKTITVGPSGQCHVENSSGCKVCVKACDKSTPNRCNPENDYFCKYFKIDWTPPTTEIK